MIANRAHAQGEFFDSAVAYVGVGVGVNFYQPSSNDAESSNGIVIMYRWHSFHSGWGPTFGLDSHSTVFHQPVGDVADVPMGSLRMRALLAGFGYRHRIHRFTAAANPSAGYSFNHLTDDSGLGPAFARTGVSLIDVHVNDSFSSSLKWASGTTSSNTSASASAPHICSTSLTKSSGPLLAGDQDDNANRSRWRRV